MSIKEKIRKIEKKFRDKDGIKILELEEWEEIKRDISQLEDKEEKILAYIYAKDNLVFNIIRNLSENERKSFFEVFDTELNQYINDLEDKKEIMQYFNCNTLEEFKIKLESKNINGVEVISNAAEELKNKSELEKELLKDLKIDDLELEEYNKKITLEEKKEYLKKIRQQEKNKIENKFKGISEQTTKQQNKQDNSTYLIALNINLTKFNKLFSSKGVKEINTIIERFKDIIFYLSEDIEESIKQKYIELIEGTFINSNIKIDVNKIIDNKKYKNLEVFKEEVLGIKESEILKIIKPKLKPEEKKEYNEKETLKEKEEYLISIRKSQKKELKEKFKELLEREKKVLKNIEYISNEAKTHHKEKYPELFEKAKKVDLLEDFKNILSNTNEKILKNNNFSKEMEAKILLATEYNENRILPFGMSNVLPKLTKSLSNTMVSNYITVEKTPEERATKIKELLDILLDTKDIHNIKFVYKYFGNLENNSVRKTGENFLFGNITPPNKGNANEILDNQYFKSINMMYKEFSNSFSKQQMVSELTIKERIIGKNKLFKKAYDEMKAYLGVEEITNIREKLKIINEKNREYKRFKSEGASDEELKKYKLSKLEKLYLSDYLNIDVDNPEKIYTEKSYFEKIKEKYKLDNNSELDNNKLYYMKKWKEEFAQDDPLLFEIDDLEKELGEYKQITNEKQKINKTKEEVEEEKSELDSEEAKKEKKEKTEKQIEVVETETKEENIEVTKYSPEVINNEKRLALFGEKLMQLSREYRITKKEFETMLTILTDNKKSFEEELVQLLNIYKITIEEFEKTISNLINEENSNLIEAEITEIKKEKTEEQIEVVEAEIIEENTSKTTKDLEVINKEDERLKLFEEKMKQLLNNYGIQPKELKERLTEIKEKYKKNKPNTNILENKS